MTAVPFLKLRPIGQRTRMFKYAGKAINIEHGNPLSFRHRHYFKRPGKVLPEGFLIAVKPSLVFREHEEASAK